MAPATELRRIGIGPVGDMAWGTHLCSFFGTIEDLLETLTPYFKAGLENQEYCMWVVSGRLTPARATTALRQVLPDLDRHLARRDLDIVSAREWYLKGGRLDLQRVIRSWYQRLRDAEARGYAGMRVTGSAGWLGTRKAWRDFLEYEGALDAAMRNRRMIVLCSYGLAASGAADVLDVAQTHQLAIARRTGDWQAVARLDLDASPNGYATLTTREREVFLLAAQGRTSPQIASQLSISERTVESHRARFMRKLGLRSQTALVRYAMLRGVPTFTTGTQ